MTTSTRDLLKTKYNLIDGETFRIFNFHNEYDNIRYQDYRRLRVEEEKLKWIAPRDRSILDFVLNQSGTRAPHIKRGMDYQALKGQSAMIYTEG